MDVKVCTVAILAADGFSAADVAEFRRALPESTQVVVVATHLGVLDGNDGSQLPIDIRLLKTSAANFDAVFVPGGDSHIEALAREPQATQFIASALGRGRVIGAAGAGRALLSMAGVHATTADEGAAGDSAAGRIVAGRIIVEDGEETLGNLMCRFIAALLQHPVQADAEPDALPSGSGFGAMPLT